MTSVVSIIIKEVNIFATNLPVCTAQGGSGSFKIANYRRLVAVIMHRRANPLMDRKVVGGSAV